MSVLPKNLAMIVQRLSNFNRQTIRIRPMSNDNAGPGQTVQFKLPTNTLIDLKNMQYIAQIAVDAQFVDFDDTGAVPIYITPPGKPILPVGWGGKDAFVAPPIHSQSLIERLEVVINGQTITGPNNDYNSLYNLLAYHLGYNPQTGSKGNHPTLTHETLEDEIENDMLNERNGEWDYQNFVYQTGANEGDIDPSNNPASMRRPGAPGIKHGEYIAIYQTAAGTPFQSLTSKAQGTEGFVAGFNQRIHLQPHDRPDRKDVTVQLSNFMRDSDNVTVKVMQNDAFHPVPLLSSWRNVLWTPGIPTPTNPPTYSGVQGNPDFRRWSAAGAATQPHQNAWNIGELASRDVGRRPTLDNKPGTWENYVKFGDDEQSALMDRYKRRRIVMEGFMGFLGGKYCRFLDTAVTGPIEIRIKLAPPGVLTCNKYRDPRLLKNVTYAMSEQYMMLDTISFTDDFYRQILARRLVEGGLITIPFDNYYNYVYPVVGTNHFVQFTAASQSLDYLIGTMREVDATTTLLPKQNDYLNNRYFTFESFAGDAGGSYKDNMCNGNAGGYQWLINNMHYPTWQANVDEIEALTKSAWDLTSDLKETCGSIYNKEIFRSKAFAHIVCLKHHSGDEKIISGLDTRGASSMMQWMVSGLNRPTPTAAAAGSTVPGSGQKNASIWACCTSTLEFSAGQNVTVVF
jgi:hypothetical protein